MASSTFIVMAPILDDLSPFLVLVVGILLAVAVVALLIKVLIKH